MGSDHSVLKAALSFLAFADGCYYYPHLTDGKFGVREVKELSGTTGLTRGKAEIWTHLEGFQASGHHLTNTSGHTVNAQQIPVTVIANGSLYRSPHLHRVLRQALGQASSGLRCRKEEVREPPDPPSARGPARRPV